MEQREKSNKEDKRLEDQTLERLSIHTLNEDTYLLLLLGEKATQEKTESPFPQILEDLTNNIEDKDIGSFFEEAVLGKSINYLFSNSTTFQDTLNSLPPLVRNVLSIKALQYLENKKDIPKPYIEIFRKTITEFEKFINSQNSFTKILTGEEHSLKTILLNWDYFLFKGPTIWEENSFNEYLDWLGGKKKEISQLKDENYKKFLGETILLQYIRNNYENPSRKDILKARLEIYKRYPKIRYLYSESFSKAKIRHLYY